MPNTDESPPTSANVPPEKELAKAGSTRMASSPQIGFPVSSSSARHSHSRSKSVNLSPTIGAAGSSFAPNTIRFEGMSNEPTSMPSSSSSAHTLSHLGPIARIGSPLLRPSSPLHINVRGSSPTGYDAWKSSPGSETSSSDGSSPDRRRSMQFSKAMERSSSSGSIGSSSSNHLLSVSPRSSLSKRTASPSRVYAVPTSPRLRALGGSSHTRNLSAGNASHLSNSLEEHSIRSTRTPPPIQPVDTAPGLPIDSVWPGSMGNNALSSSTAQDAIHIGVNKSQSTPIPPSLRDELSAKNVDNEFTTIYPSAASPNMRPLSVSPQDEFNIYRHLRTPSPSLLTKRRSSGSPALGSPSPKNRPHSSPLLLPTLAAPKAISRRAFNLETGQYAPAQPTFIANRHHRTLSDSSSGSNLSDTDPTTEDSSPRFESSATQKMLSPSEGAQAKLDAHNAIAEVILGPNVSTSHEGGRFAELSDQSKDGKEATEAEGTEENSSNMGSTKAFASTHGITISDLPSNRRNSLIRTSSQPNMNYMIMIGPDGNLVRARSPAIPTSKMPSPRMETIPLGESPPKTRSFLGMPPRSGYDLSDDPDDVGSDNGSTGSGKNSINEDRDNEDDDDYEEEVLDDRDDASQGSSSGSYDETNNSAPDNLTRPMPFPKRPSLFKVPIRVPVSHTEFSNQDEEAAAATATLLWQGKEATPKRGDLALTRDEGVDEGEDDDEEGDEQEQNGNDTANGQQLQNNLEVTAEESLSTLERIFLFAKSEMTYRRVLVSHSLADWILEVELSDAVEFVIPLLNGLACDENEVCTAFAPHLHRVMWYFFRNCPLVEDDTSTKESQIHENGDCDDDMAERATRPKVSVSVFTPLLCALLLNYNAAIAGSTQSSIVRFFARLQGFDFPETDEEQNEKLPEEEQMQPQSQQFSSGKVQNKTFFNSDTGLVEDAAAREDKRVLLEEYNFDERARRMIMEELLHHVALAIGNLNVEQTTQAREMMSNEEKPEVKHLLLSEGDEEDAVMDEVPLNATSATSATNAATNAESDSTSSNEEATEIDSGDTEMSMEFLGESQDDGLATGGASLDDNESMTMSDVEEEVAVGRMASISLLAALGAEELVSRDFLTNRIVPELIRSSVDHTFFVRKEVAVAMGALAMSIGYQVMKQNDLLTIFDHFCRDRIWHVRQAACLSLPNLFSQVQDADLKRIKVVETMRIFVNDVSHNVRVAALDIIGEMIYLFHKDSNGVPSELVRHFMGESYDLEAEKAEGEGVNLISSSLDSSGSESMMQHQNQDSMNGFADTWGNLQRSISTTNANGPSGWSLESQVNNSYKSSFHHADLMDSDRPLVMAYNFPAVMLTLGKAHWSMLKPVHKRLCNSISPKARRSLAASLHEVAKIIGQESTSEDLLELVQHFLDGDIEKDEQVKMAMLQNLDVFMENLTLDKALETLKYMLQLWNEESNGDSSRISGNWRLREKVISLIPNLAKDYLMKDDEGVLVVLMQSAIVDSVSSVRQQGIKVVGSLYSIFEENDQVLADGFLGMLVDVGENESYRSRVACLHCLTALCKSQLRRSSVEMLMMNRLVELSKDNVVDVRIALAQLVSLMCHLDQLYALPASRSETFVNLLRRLFYDRSELVGKILMTAVKEGDPGREPPNPWPSPRVTRELILGPSDGSLHRPPISEHSFDLNGDSTGEVQSFDMDDEVFDSQMHPSNMPGNEFSNSSNELPSLLGKSTLMRRRLRNRPQGHIDADSSMFENKDDDEDERSRQPGGRKQEVNNFLMLSTSSKGSSSSSSSSSIGDDSFDADEPHHLLGTSSDSPLRNTTSVDHNDVSASSHNLSLESPERPWNRNSSSESILSINQPTIESPSLVSPGPKTSDPFLAFVADKRHDHNSSSDIENHRNSSIIDETTAKGQERILPDSQ